MQNYKGQCNVPRLPPATTYVEVAAGESHSVARRSDGSVVAWGSNQYGQCNVPVLPYGQTYVEVAAGGQETGAGGHTLARRSDGWILAWGANFHGQCQVPVLPPGLGYVEIAAGYLHSVARRSDGSVIAWGDNTFGQCDVPGLPPGLAYVEVSAGYGRTVARIGPADPTVHCTAKTSSSSCEPAIGFQGVPSASGGVAFLITASRIEHQTFGLFFYGKTGKHAVAFQGGTLCANPPLTRTASQSSGGSPPCSGSFSMDFNAYVASGTDPSLVAGTTVNGQYWFRDPGFAPPNNTGLTNAIEFTLAP